MSLAPSNSCCCEEDVFPAEGIQTLVTLPFHVLAVTSFQW